MTTELYITEEKLNINYIHILFIKNFFSNYRWKKQWGPRIYGLRIGILILLIYRMLVLGKNQLGMMMKKTMRAKVDKQIQVKINCFSLLHFQDYSIIKNKIRNLNE